MDKVPVILSFNDAAKEKTFFSGSIQPCYTRSWIKDNNSIKYSRIYYSPRIYNHINEIIINACDQYNDMIGTQYPVKEIDIVYEASRCLVYNSGMGFNTKDEGIHVTNALTKEYCSSNHGKGQRYTGGVNGLGLKVVVVNSSWFSIHTIDPVRDQTYIHTFKQGVSSQEELVAGIRPITSDLLNGTRSSGTLIQFEPDSKEIPSDKLPGILANIRKLVAMRAYEIGIYMNTIKGPSITFNSSPITDSFAQYIKHFDEDAQIVNVAKHIRCSIGVCIAGISRKYSALVNCLKVTKYDLVDTLYKKIYDKILAYLTKSFNKDHEDKIASIVKSKLFLVFMGRVSQECYAPDSQSKDQLKCICDQCRSITLSVDQICRRFLDIATKQLSRSTDKSRQAPKQYQEAKYAGTRKSKDCVLLVSEGNSAIGVVRKIITSKCFPYDPRYYGILSITGVPKNIVKDIKEIRQTNSGQYVHTKKNSSSKGFKDIEYAMGLDRNLTYKTAKELAGLNYGTIVMAFDQDLDGIGQICSLIISDLYFIYPAIFQNGMVKRLNTPIVSAYTRAKPYFFIKEDDFDVWYKGNKSKVTDILYLKGIGSCTKIELNYISKEFSSLIVDYNTCEEDINTIRMFYCKDSEARKTMIRKGITDISPDTSATITIHLLSFCVLFWLYKNLRQIPCYVDGLNLSQRKILYTIRKNKKRNMFQKAIIFGSNVVESTNYVHGDMSLHTTISMLAQNYMGARNLPVLVGSEGAGSIDTDRESSCKPRYLYVMYNKLMSILFPPEDDRFLPLTYSDGKVCEPRYYIPMLPLSILELFSTTGAGWNIHSFPRSLKIVIDNVYRKLYDLDPINMDTTPWRYPDLLYYTKRDTLYIEGTYTWNGSCITVKQLPPQVWVLPYSNKLKAGHFGEYIKKINNYTKDNNICLEIEIYPKHRESVDQMDKEGTLSSELCLRKIYSTGLNMIDDETGSILEFKTYLDIFNTWYERRYTLYAKRIKFIILRTKLLRKLTLLTLLFIQVHYKPAYFQTLTQDKLVEYYKSKGYPGIDTKLLYSSQLDLDSLGRILTDRTWKDYEYLNSITVRQTLKGNIDKLKGKVAKYNQILRDKPSVRGLWLDDITRFKECYLEGIRTDWLYEKYHEP